MSETKHHADYTEDVFDSSSFYKASLENCDFEQAELNYSTFTRADLSFCNFKNAYMNFVDLRGADLTGALITKSQLKELYVVEDYEKDLPINMPKEI